MCVYMYIRMYMYTCIPLHKRKKILNFKLKKQLGQPNRQRGFVYIYISISLNIYIYIRTYV